MKSTKYKFFKDVNKKVKEKKKPYGGQDQSDSAKAKRAASRARRKARGE